MILSLISTKSSVLYSQNTITIYDSCKLNGKIEYKVFELAMTGYKILLPKKKNIITIIDYSKPSTEKRFFVIDLDNNKLLYHCLVAHGVNSGELNATDFSNVPASRKSSLGFYLTAETIICKHGYSLILDGKEPGINDKARARSIIIHKAWYVSNEFIKQYKRLGRSWGCPALPEELNKSIIDLIKDGSCLFIYAKDEDYLSKSKILN